LPFVYELALIGMKNPTVTRNMSQFSPISFARQAPNVVKSLYTYLRKLLGTRLYHWKGVSMNLHLKVVRGKPRGHCLAFPVGEYMIGRGPECDVRPNSDLVSRQHCLLHITDDSVTIRDLGSMNGTLVNGQLVTDARPLTQGDTLQIGPLVLEVLLDAEATAVAGALSDTVQADLKATAEEPITEKVAIEPLVPAEAR
jgi:hypothetical protein